MEERAVNLAIQRAFGLQCGICMEKPVFITKQICLQHYQAQHPTIYQVTMELIRRNSRMPF